MDFDDFMEYDYLHEEDETPRKHSPNRTPQDHGGGACGCIFVFLLILLLTSI